MIERIDEESLIPHSRNISARFTTRNDFKHLINQLSRNAFLEINDSTLNREFRHALRNSSMNIQLISRTIIRLNSGIFGVSTPVNESRIGLAQIPGN